MKWMFHNKYIWSLHIILSVSSVPSLPSLIGRNGGKTRDVHLINTHISTAYHSNVHSLLLSQCPRLESLGCTKYLLRGPYFPISLFSWIYLEYAAGNEASVITTADRTCSSIDKCCTKGSRRFGGGWSVRCKFSFYFCCFSIYFLVTVAGDFVISF